MDAIKLVWEGPDADGNFVATVPAKDYHPGPGKFVFHAVPRPRYCDRGKWTLMVEPVNVDLDDQEGFPRYYFKLENLQEEMEFWANARDSCLEAAKLGLKAL